MQRITLIPDPPVEGVSLQVCYAFDGSGLTQVTLTIVFTPGGQSSSPNVSESAPCTTVAVPHGAQRVTVTDQGGSSSSISSPVVR